MNDRPAPPYGPPGLVIRATEPADAESVWETMDQPGVVRGTLQLPWRSREWRRSLVEKWVADTNVHSFIAELDGRGVGNAGLHVKTGPRQRHVGAFGMSVHDEFHGRGIGSALLHAICTMADDWLNLRRLELEVYCDNEAGVALYRKFGFEIEGTLRDYAYREGEFVDAYVMARLRRARD